MHNPVLIDALITWLSAYVCFVYAVQSRLEAQLPQQRILWWVVALFLAARGVWWLYPSAWLGAITTGLASLLPLAILLYTEQLLRRHAPVWLKRGIAYGALSLLFLGLITPSGGRAYLGLALLAYQLCAIAAIVWLVWQRDRAQLHADENTLLERLKWVGIAALPLLASDFRNDLGLLDVRAGSLAFLLFIYAFIRQPSLVDNKGALLRDTLIMTLKSAVLSLAFMVVLGQFHLAAFQQLLALSITVVLSITLLEQLKQRRSHSQEQAFTQWLKTVSTNTIDSFVEALHRCPNLADAWIPEPHELERYDALKLAQWLKTYGGPIAMKDVEQLIPKTEEPYLLEALQELLTTQQASHICLLSTEPAQFLLTSHTQASESGSSPLQLQVIHRLAESICTSSVPTQS